MKKGTVIIALLGIIVIAGYALFKTLTNKNDGNTQTNQREAESTPEKEEAQGRKEEGTRETA